MSAMILFPEDEQKTQFAQTKKEQKSLLCSADNLGEKTCFYNKLQKKCSEKNFRGPHINQTRHYQSFSMKLLSCLTRDK